MATETKTNKNKITNLIMLHDALVTINFFWQINPTNKTKNSFLCTQAQTHQAFHLSRKYLESGKL